MKDEGETRKQFNHFNMINLNKVQNLLDFGRLRYYEKKEYMSHYLGITIGTSCVTLVNGLLGIGRLYFVIVC